MAEANWQGWRANSSRSFRSSEGAGRPVCPHNPPDVGEALLTSRSFALERVVAPGLQGGATLEQLVAVERGGEFGGQRPLGISIHV